MCAETSEIPLRESYTPVLLLLFTLPHVYESFWTTVLQCLVLCIVHAQDCLNDDVIQHCLVCPRALSSVLAALGHYSPGPSGLYRA